MLVMFLFSYFFLFVPAVQLKTENMLLIFFFFWTWSLRVFYLGPFFVFYGLISLSVIRLILTLNNTTVTLFLKLHIWTRIMTIPLKPNLNLKTLKLVIIEILPKRHRKVLIPFDYWSKPEWQFDVLL